MDIHNKLEQLQKNFNELNSLFELSTMVNQSFTSNELILNVTNFIKKQFNVENIYFFINSNGVFHAPQIESTIKPTNIEFDAKQLDLWSMFNNVNIVDIYEDPKAIKYKTLLMKYNLYSLNCQYACVLKDNNDYCCLILISKKINGNKLEINELKYLNRIIKFIEPVYIKHDKKRNERQDLKNLNKVLHNMSILYNISQAVNFIDDLKRLLNVILDKAIETTEAERGSLMLYDYTDNSLQVKVVYGLKDKEIEKSINNGIIECSKFKPNEGIAGEVFVKKVPIITNLGENDPRFVKGNVSTSTTSLLCVPLVVKGESIGVINISNKIHGKMFNKEDLEFMEALANQAAIAIDNAKLYELATKDGLTKLYIYRHFYTLLENEIQRSQRYNRNMSLLMMDIDYFKQINDTYGHLIGDQILREIANTINHTVRKIDVPARYGGEEFAIILPETKLKDASIIAERLRENIKKIVINYDEKTIVKATVSIGIAEFPQHGSFAKNLINCADIALYCAKNNGRDCTYGYDHETCVRMTEVIHSHIENK